MLILLLACAPGADDTGSPLDDSAGCSGEPTVEIVRPAEGDVIPEGDTVTLEGEAHGIGNLRYQWGIDSDVVATGSTDGWTAAGQGDHVVTLQVDDDCGSGEDTVRIRVSAP